MKVFLKKATVKRLTPAQQIPEQTTERIKAALERARDKHTVVVCKVPSSKQGKPPYNIVVGKNNTVWCTCNGFKYRSECRHMDRFRKEIKPQTLS